MSSLLTGFPRPSALRLLIGAVALLGLAITFAALATDASAGDAEVVVNSTANVDDGDCEGPPNAGSGNCTLHEAIDAVNNGDADIIRFHPPVFSKASPGLINLCEDTGPGSLPVIKRDVFIDSSDTGVVLDGGDKDDGCGDPSPYGIVASAQSNGLDFELDGGKNFDIVNLNCEEDDDDKFDVAAGIAVTGVEQGDEDYSLGTIEISGVLVENVCDDAIVIEASNLQEATITNSELSSNRGAGIDVEIDACIDDCELGDSVLDISDNRIEGGVDYPGQCDCSDNGVDILYRGILNSKVTASVSENEFIRGTNEGVQFDFIGCGDGSGVNVHVDDNEEIDGGDYDAVDVSIWADGCTTEAGAVAGGNGGPIPVTPGETTDNFDAVVTVNDNGDIETSGIDTDDGEGVTVNVYTCCHESDSSATVEVNDNGRITGEEHGVAVDTYICCGDDNTSDVSVNDNDEITGEGGVGVLVEGFAGSSSDAEFAGVAGGTGWDADDNTCVINVEGNDEIDGVESDGVALICFAGTFGDSERRIQNGIGAAGAPNSSGDNNVTTINLIDNSDIAGDYDGAYINGVAGSFDGEADKNLVQTTVRDNGEISGDENDGVEIELLAGSPVDEGDDNDTEATVEENAEIGGNGGDGLDIESFSGGVTDGSEGDGTMVLIVQNGSIEGDGDEDDGIEIDSVVCCDHENTNDISILDNKDEITGHDDDGIDIETCCSVNTITIMDNQDNIRGGDDDGLELDVCGATVEFPLFFAGAAGDGPPDFVDCLKNSITNLMVLNNSFNDSEEDGISIENGGVFADEDEDIKSVIAENSIHGNGGDGIDVESGSGLNIGPDNSIHNNGTAAGDNGIEIDWYFGGCVWFHPEFSNKFLANGNRITENSIYDNFGLGIDLVGFDEDDDFFEDDCDTEPTGDADGDGGLADESLVGCVPFTETAINPNDCLAFPELKTQSQNKLLGTACSLCEVEIFWADDNPDNNSHHGEGRTYLVTGEADEDGNFSIELPCDLDGGDLTATATDKLKNTSEFSENLSTLGTSDCATETPEDTDTPTPTDTPVATNTPTNTNTPVATPTNTAIPPTATSTKLCGDVNDDGAVNSLDANLILQLVVRRVTTLPNVPSGDVNNDGATNSVDSSLILQLLVNLIGPDDLHCPN